VSLITALLEGEVPFTYHPGITAAITAAERISGSGTA
jgi:hypothetical protein